MRAALLSRVLTTDRGDWSDARRFVVRGSPPAQVAPAADSYGSGSHAFFGWRPVAGVVGYRFERRLVARPRPPRWSAPRA